MHAVILELDAFSKELSQGKKKVTAQKCRTDSPEMIELHSFALPSKQEYATNQLLITGIPEGISEEYLVTFLDASLDLDHDVGDYTFTMKKTCALVHFSRHYSIDGKYNNYSNLIHHSISIVCII